MSNNDLASLFSVICFWIDIQENHCQRKFLKLSEIVSCRIFQQVFFSRSLTSTAALQSVSIGGWTIWLHRSAYHFVSRVWKENVISSDSSSSIRLISSLATGRSVSVESASLLLQYSIIKFATTPWAKPPLQPSRKFITDRDNSSPTVSRNPFPPWRRSAQAPSRRTQHVSWNRTMATVASPNIPVPKSFDLSRSASRKWGAFDERWYHLLFLFYPSTLLPIPPSFLTWRSGCFGYSHTQECLSTASVCHCKSTLEILSAHRAVKTLL